MTTVDEARAALLTLLTMWPEGGRPAVDAFEAAVRAEYEEAESLKLMRLDRAWEERLRALREAAQFPRNVSIHGQRMDAYMKGAWVAVPKDDFDALRAALADAPAEERREPLDVERLQKAVLDEATCARWGDLHSIRWASETFAALVAERYNGTMPAEYARLEAADAP